MCAQEKPALNPLRRGEIVAFGTLPFTIFLATFAVDTTRYMSHNFDSRYAPWPFKGAGAFDMSDTEKGIALGVAVGTSVIIALIDYFIVKKKTRTPQRDAPRIERSPRSYF
ncbi:hypothetical protein FACS1894164_09300 [Spirochaetia bacterium]|nr:hypothetical protein FACS1894164_09300 [Spirochaetia bacterium]